jgi:hypothetical protein
MRKQPVQIKAAENNLDLSVVCACVCVWRYASQAMVKRKPSILQSRCVYKPVLCCVVLVVSSMDADARHIRQTSVSNTTPDVAGSVDPNLK